MRSRCRSNSNPSLEWAAKGRGKRRTADEEEDLRAILANDSKFKLLPKGEKTIGQTLYGIPFANQGNAPNEDRSVLRCPFAEHRKMDNELLRNGYSLSHSA